MINLLLPFAMRRTDGELVAPEEVSRGLSCDCACPECQRPVVSKQGTEKVWHFAHHGAEACDRGYEKAVHEQAKRLLRDRRTLVLPPLEALQLATNAFGRMIEAREQVFEGRIVTLDECRFDVQRGAVTTDVLGVLKGREIQVELTVFHRLMPNKIERLAATGVATLEIDLSEFKHCQATRARLEQAMFERVGNRRWIFHPFLAEAERRVRARLEDQLAEAKDRQDALQREALAIQAQMALDRAERLRREGSSSGLIWRSTLPSDDSIRQAQTQLAARSKKPLINIIRVTNEFQRRKDLNPHSPEDVARRWAEALDVEPKEILRFLFDGGFVM